MGKNLPSCDPVVLTYENSLLRKSDVDILNSEEWLDDSIIAFWFEYLENDLYKEHKDMLGFVCPQTVQYLKFANLEDVKSTIEVLELHKKKYVFFPLNDCGAEIDSGGGTHWTLLVYNAQATSFQHYDSSPKIGLLSVAERLAKILVVFLSDSSKLVKDTLVEDIDCTLQNNNYDCGMHVICNTEGLCRKFILGDSRPLSQIVTTTVISSSRDMLRDLIHSLKK